MVELLGAPDGQGRQFIAPPSTHPTKGAYVWDGGFDPARIATIDAEDLERRVRHLGVAALIAEHMPESGRHELSKALAGLMLRDDRESLETVEAIFESAWNAVDGDTQAALKNARDTAEKLCTGGKVTGGKEVNKIIKGLAGRIADALGWEERDRPLTEEEQQALVQAAADKAWANPRVQALAGAENILHKLYCRVRDGGLVGEQINAELLLLAGVSLCRGNPISAIVKGTSSVGKSETIKAVSHAFPPEMVIEKQSMSDKYLAYAGENGELKNKLLVVYELGGFGAEGSEGLEMAKQLMSEGRISRGTVDKGDGKQNAAREIVTEGPTALWTTTTKVKTDYELGNRVFELTPDDGRDQTRAINELVFDYDADEVEHDFSDAHGLFRWLLGQENRVYFPYGKALGQLIPNEAVKMRREAKRIRYLLDAHAMLHQQSRERDEHRRILANLDDYAAVKRLVESFVGESSELGVKAEVRETVMAAERIMNPEEGEYEHPGVTVREIAEALKLDNASANRRLHGASPYLVRLDDKRKNALQFGRGEALPESGHILPTREELAAHHATFALLHANPDPQGSPNGNGSVSIQNDAKVRAKFVQKSEIFVPSQNENPHRNGDSSEGDTADEGNSAWGSIGVQKCKSPESEDRTDATFVQKPGTFARGHAKVEERGEGPKAEDAPRVVHVRSGEPWHVYIGRGNRGGGKRDTGLRKSKWHNPFKIGPDGTREEVIEKYERYLREQPELMAALPELRGKTLACHCAPGACHGDVLLKLANGGDSDPLAERRAWVAERRNERRKEVYFNDPARYHELPINEKISLRAWVQKNIAPRQVTSPRSSYNLKHVAERFLGFYSVFHRRWTGRR